MLEDSGHLKGALRRLDAFPKPGDDFRIRTFSGGTVTIVCSILIACLVVTDLLYFLTVDVKTELLVDFSRSQKMRLFFDIRFLSAPCDILSTDIMDVSGEQQLDVEANLFKRRLDSNGNAMGDFEKHPVGSTASYNATKAADPTECGSCYGAESVTIKCCNSCDDVKKAYKLKGWAVTDLSSFEQCRREGLSGAPKVNVPLNQGCQVFGFVELNKVAGNMHFAPGHSFQQSSAHIHDVSDLSSISFNMTHRIEYLSFGNHYPGIVNPLDNVVMVDQLSRTMFQYYVKVVPTKYIYLNGLKTDTNQFSVTTHSKQVMGAFGEGGLPGVFFMYDFSPMLVKYTEYRRSLAEFLTNCCAIVGGIFTVASLVDAGLYHSGRYLKSRLNKVS